jgi:hypothetical protein
MDTYKGLSLEQFFFMYEDLFGEIQLNTFERGGALYHSATLSASVERRGDGMLSGVSGCGHNEASALQDLFEELTKTGGYFFSVSQYVYSLQARVEKHVAWNGRRFYELDDVSDLYATRMLVKANYLPSR